MGLKNWWANKSLLVKCGIIGLLIGLIVNLITSILENIYVLDIAQTIPSKPYILDFLLNFISIPNLIIFIIFLYILYIIEIAFYWFLIGVLFGWILEKRESSDKKWIYTFFILVLGISLLIYIGFLTNMLQPATNNLNSLDNSQISDLPENRNLVINGGACIIESQEKTCIFEIKENCEGNFNQGLLCTAEQLQTICGPTKNSLTIEGKKYFIDSCGNQANPYDKTQFTNKSYWTYALQIR